MRKIESEMLAAIREGRNWNGSNTQVMHFKKDSGITFCQVCLHGNHIADIWDKGLCGEVYPAEDTFRRWPTRTTVSRLRALGLNASIKGGRPHLNGEPI